MKFTGKSVKMRRRATADLIEPLNATNTNQAIKDQFSYDKDRFKDKGFCKLCFAAIPGSRGMNIFDTVNGMSIHLDSQRYHLVSKHKVHAIALGIDVEDVKRKKATKYAARNETTSGAINRQRPISQQQDNECLEMNAVCRLCAQNTVSPTSVFTFQRGRLLSDMIQLICPIKIDPADEIKQICQKCLKIVLDAHELRERSVRSDIKFKTEAFSSHSVEKVNVKQESDPFQSEIMIENEEMDFSDIEDKEVLSDDSNDLLSIIPLIPQKKFSKYQYEVVDRKYKCPAENCGRLFSQTTSINRHINTDHKGEKINYAKKKETVRKDEKEFTCYVCGISFQNNSGFSAHMRNKHPGKLQGHSHPLLPARKRKYNTRTSVDKDESDVES